jgi:translation elongation factor IF5A
VVIKGRPCKVVDVSTAKTGKHGHAKCTFTGLDVFSGKKFEDVIPAHQNVDVPYVRRRDYTLLDIQDDGFVSLLDDSSGDTKDDLKLPDDNEQLASNIQKMMDDGKTVTCTTLSVRPSSLLIPTSQSSFPSISSCSFPAAVNGRGEDYRCQGRRINSSFTPCCCIPTHTHCSTAHALVHRRLHLIGPPARLRAAGLLCTGMYLLASTLSSNCSLNVDEWS